MSVGEKKVSLMTFLATVPDDVKIYVVKPGDTTPYYTTKSALLDGIVGGSQGFNDVLVVDEEVTTKDAIFRLDADKYLKINRANQSVEIWDLSVSSVAALALYANDNVNFQNGVNQAVFNANYTTIQDGTNEITLTGSEILISDGATSFRISPTRIQINGVDYPFPTGTTSQIATKLDIDNAVSGMLDLRGAYDASGNAFPTTGGSGTAGAILKGDFWYVSVAGILNGVSVNIGDSFFALNDSPTSGQWQILESNLGYVPENTANKTDTMAGNTASSTKYLSAKGVYDWAIGLFATITNLALKLDKSASAHTMRANNTSGTADVTDFTFKQVAQQTYSGTETWTGTAPSTATKTYTWSQIGNTVNLRMNFVYVSPGASNTAIVIPLPTDCPNPLIPTGLTGSSVTLYSANGFFYSSINTANSTSTRSYLRRNVADTGFELVIISSSIAAVGAWFQVTYFTN